MIFVKNKFWVVVLAMSLAFLLPRISDLGRDISNSDALRWHRRSDNFLSALKTKEFGNTFQRYHPGVTAMWSGVLSEVLLYKYQQSTGEKPDTLENADFYPLLHSLSKLVVVLVLAFCFVLQLFLIRKLFDPKVAFIYGFLISVEPYFVGIDRWFHLSSMEAFFSMTSVLFLLAFSVEKKLRYLVLSGFFVGLGLLTKMTVFITVLFSVLYLVRGFFKENIKFKFLLLYAMAAIATFFVFFPALWVKPAYVFSSMYLAATNAVFEDVRGDVLTLNQKIFFYPVIFMFKTSPLLLFAGIYSLLRVYREKNKYILALVTYFLILIVFLTVADQKIDRYSIAFFPTLILIVAYTLSKAKNSILALLLVGQSVFFLWATITYYPVYSAYINPIFTHKFVLNAGFYDNSGEYFSNAAFYMNKKGRNLYTQVPNNMESFKPYYKGNLTPLLEDADYVVYSLDFDRKYFPEIPHCRIENYFGNRLYKPVAVYACEN
ncbi:hypothetical protein A2380_03250 [candidate division WWE3 bacterium RIFOXYB1_FULL_43_24]|uniref:Glycosyltransferase RgtA/B/C/D-like domain-containing protein n=2 Tax=Katanobacteria TaxID=422282 RepID=A0A0G1BL58_UNCKA|nr:MAG: hypothetical protein UU92_C0009G0020 [candidate division WWE3 bacterium GW2011_GWA1_42_12]KKS34773.1 MAG: hypothetical protein UU97_C0006G0012 [candidate division WWE3 bacterium GW2011_GWD1_42_14]KKS38188.1 MAG: hypothetical protein UV00_C0008G0020 [candidate division WWE3 bacterium GW2011_GWF1_42_14]KKS40325.1 MAG: hypothetical protein UV03_C0008G0020 [candidate division WWE3 bacterium GW2011_GWE1_42_16]KKS67160.1 MAG: hypothetical protein UV35_C0002G0020 [candidate division WWE3 bacte